MADRVTNTPPPGFVKLPRAILLEDWSREPLQLSVFVHLLLRANREACTWNGISLERGQLVTSLRSLSMSCGLSISQVRTVLQSLCRAGVARLLTHPAARLNGGNAARFAARGYTVVTVCNFDSYEGTTETPRTLSRTPQQSDTARPAARSIAIDKEYKEIIFNILPESFLPLVLDWLAYKRERGETYKGKKGITQFCNRLRDLSAGDLETARRIVSNSMANNYAGIFPDRSAPTPATPATGSRTSTRRANNPRLSIGDYTPEDYTSTI